MSPVRALLVALFLLAAASACQPLPGNIENVYTLGPTAAVVGDSLTNSGRSYLHAELQRHFATRIGAVAGSTYGSMMPYSQDYSDDHTTIAVIALGTNDRNRGIYTLEQSLANLTRTYDLFDGSCTVGLTVVADSGVAELDAAAVALNEAATARADVMVDWATVMREPGMTGADGVHATPEGYQRRAQLIARAAEACGDEPHVPPTTTTAPDTTTTTAPDTTTTAPDTTTTAPDTTTTAPDTTTTAPDTTTTAPDTTLPN